MITAILVLTYLLFYKEKIGFSKMNKPKKKTTKQTEKINIWREIQIILALPYYNIFIRSLHGFKKIAEEKKRNNKGSDDIKVQWQIKREITQNQVILQIPHQYL